MNKIKAGDAVAGQQYLTKSGTTVTASELIDDGLYRRVFDEDDIRTDLPISYPLTPVKTEPDISGLVGLDRAELEPQLAALDPDALDALVEADGRGWIVDVVSRILMDVDDPDRATCEVCGASVLLIHGEGSPVTEAHKDADGGFCLGSGREEGWTPTPTDDDEAGGVDALPGQQLIEGGEVPDTDTDTVAQIRAVLERALGGRYGDGTQTVLEAGSALIALLGEKGKRQHPILSILPLLSKMPEDEALDFLAFLGRAEAFKDSLTTTATDEETDQGEADEQQSDKADLETSPPTPTATGTDPDIAKKLEDLGAVKVADKKPADTDGDGESSGSTWVSETEEGRIIQVKACDSTGALALLRLAPTPQSTVTREMERHHVALERVIDASGRDISDKAKIGSLRKTLAGKRAQSRPGVVVLIERLIAGLDVAHPLTQEPEETTTATETATETEPKRSPSETSPPAATSAEHDPRSDPTIGDMVRPTRSSAAIRVVGKLPIADDGSHWFIVYDGECRAVEAEALRSLFAGGEVLLVGDGTVAPGVAWSAAEFAGRHACINDLSEDWNPYGTETDDERAVHDAWLAGWRRRKSYDEYCEPPETVEAPTAPEAAERPTTDPSALTRMMALLRDAAIEAKGQGLRLTITLDTHPDSDRS